MASRSTKRAGASSGGEEQRALKPLSAPSPLRLGHGGPSGGAFYLLQADGALGGRIAGEGGHLHAATTTGMGYAVECRCPRGAPPAVPGRRAPTKTGLTGRGIQPRAEAEGRCPGVGRRDNQSGL